MSNASKPVAVRDSIRSFRFEPDQWLWCAHCERFFQGRDARPDFLGGMQACAFEQCDGAGHHVDIFEWDEWPRCYTGKLTWPAFEELRKGLVANGWAEEPAGAFDCFSDPPAFGFGAALNQDCTRRDAIMGIFTRPGEPTWFYNLDVARLELLVAENFMPLDTPIGYCPPTRKVLEFVRRWPQVLAHGMALPAGEFDYRVTIDALECRLDTVRPADRARLVAEFNREFETDGTVEDDTLKVSWG